MIISCHCSHASVAIQYLVFGGLTIGFSVGAFFNIRRAAALPMSRQ